MPLTAAVGRAAVGVVLMTLVLTGCSSSRSTTDQSTSSSPSASSKARSTPVGFNPPGPPGPTVPDDVGAAVPRWWALLQHRSCKTLITRTSATIAADPGGQTEALRAAAHVYRAAGEVCVNKLTAAGRDVKVDVSASGWTDCSGHPVLLQRWVRLMIKALRGDAAARRTVQSFPDPKPCVSASPSPEDTGAASPGPSSSQSASSSNG